MASDEKTAAGAGTEQPGRSEPDAPGHHEERSATQDLAEGIDLMLRAARKAMRGLDPGRVEELGRRAVRSVESLDARRVQELGRKAAQHMDPRKIEDIAEEAGRELLGVVERVADRVESVVGSRRTRGSRPDHPEGADEESDAKKRVRVEDDK